MNGLAQIAPVAPAADVHAYVSPSRLKLWLQCPRKFELRYVLGIPTPSTPGLVIGKAVHAGLQDFYNYRMRGITVFPEYLTERTQMLWAATLLEEPGVFANQTDALAARIQVEGLLRAYVKQLDPEEPAPVAIEQRFEAPLVDPANREDLGINLVGIVDLVLDAERPVVVDFKTTARSSNHVDLIHELQLTAYSYLHRTVTGRDEHALEIRSLVKTKQPKIETRRFPPRQDRHFTRFFDVVRAYLDAIHSGRFHVRPGMECSFCDYRQGCAA